MQNIQLHSPDSGKHTMISNIFIDCYMPKANGEYVKLYLCLLRQASERSSVSIEAIADLFDYTEKDVRRGLRYWADQGLLKLEYAPDHTICSLTFLEPERPKNQAAVSICTAQSKDASKMAETAAAKITADSLTADRICALKNNPDIRQLLFIAESYLSRTLSPSEINSLLYYYDCLHFDPDLIEYLIEYCISRGRTSFHYINRVAAGWAEAGVKNVIDAKNHSSQYSKKYYSVLNAFGIKGRGPAKTEAAMIDHWFDDLHFTSDIILEACSRTISLIQQPHFGYANKILESWHKNGIRHLSDIKVLDEEHQKRTNTAEKQPEKPAKNNKFNNFSQRDYDFGQLETRLLNQ